MNDGKLPTIMRTTMAICVVCLGVGVSEGAEGEEKIVLNGVPYVIQQARLD